MRVAVIGSGAMGSIFGSALARCGDTVTFYDTRPELVAAVSRDGLSLEGSLGEFHSRPKITSDVKSLAPADCALVLVDANATPTAARAAAECLVPGGFVLTMQNGIGNVEALAEVLGAKRVLAGSTYNSGAQLGLGRVLHSNKGPTFIGELDGATTARAKDIAEKFSKAGMPTEVSDNVMGVVWSKFIHNCAINAICAITSLRPGEIARDAPAAALLDLLLDEILAVVERSGVRLAEHDPRGEIHEFCWPRFNKASMQQHMEAGRPTEIDALNGALVKRAKSLGMAAPANEAITCVIKALESARRARDANPMMNEAALEAAARAAPRNGRWGAG